MTLGLMGGDMQAQGHEQIAVDIIDLGANVQQAGDMARFRHAEISDVLSLESPLYDLVGDRLRAMGYTSSRRIARRWADIKRSCYYPMASMPADRISEKTAKPSAGKTSAAVQLLHGKDHGKCDQYDTGGFFRILFEDVTQHRAEGESGERKAHR